MEVKDPSHVKLERVYYQSTTDVNSGVWDSVVPRATGLKHSVLSTFEDSAINDLTCHYLMFHAEGNAVGKANLYETAMDFTTMDRAMSPAARRAMKHWHPNFLNFNMVECGLFAMNGDGLVVQSERHLKMAIEAVDQELHRIAENKDLDLLVFRDVPLEHYQAYEEVLVPRGYAPAVGFTNAVIDIEWTSLEDYLASLNSKTRHKLKTALKINEKFDIRVEITSDYSHLAKVMAKLWGNVNASSEDYSREQLDEEFFRESGRRLGDLSEAILFYHGDQLVAFMWNLIGDDDYHMADWGVDYSFEYYKEANFYRAASVLSLERAITLQKKRMQLGMTNYTPKKLLGAQMQPLVYFIKHNRCPELSATVSNMITDAIEQPDTLSYYETSDWPESGIPSAEFKEDIKNKTKTFKASDAFSAVNADYTIDLLRLGGIYPFYPSEVSISTNLAKSYYFSYSKDPLALETDRDLPAALHNTSPPCTSGVGSEVLRLQEGLADRLGQESAQVFSSGSGVHAAILSAIVEPEALLLKDDQCGPVLSEAVNHSGGEVMSFNHNDVELLEATLIDNPGRKIIIVTESVFASYGDRARLAEIIALKIRFRARLYLDESHALGILGSHGEGLAGLSGMAKQVDIIAGSTFPSTGLDCGFVAASSSVVNFLRHEATALAFSANISPCVASLLTSALRAMESNFPDRQACLIRAKFFAEDLAANGFEVLAFDFPIINIVLGDFMLALAMQKALLDRGVLVSLVGPPLVSPDRAMLRLVVGSDISPEQLDDVMAHLCEAKEYLQ